MDNTQRRDDGSASQSRSSRYAASQSARSSRPAASQSSYQPRSATSRSAGGSVYDAVDSVDFQFSAAQQQSTTGSSRYAASAQPQQQSNSFSFAPAQQPPASDSRYAASSQRQPSGGSRYAAPAQSQQSSMADASGAADQSGYSRYASTQAQQRSNSHFATVQRKDEHKTLRTVLIAVGALLIIALIVYLVFFAFGGRDKPATDDPAQQGQAAQTSSTEQASPSADPSAEAGQVGDQQTDAPAPDGSTDSNEYVDPAAYVEPEPEPEPVYEEPPVYEEYVDPNTYPWVYDYYGNYLGIADPWVPAGYFTTGNPQCDWEVKCFCDWFSVSDNVYDNIYNTYLHVSWYNYSERADNQAPSGHDWYIDYALQTIYEDGGNCYNFVALLQVCFQYFGLSDAWAFPAFIWRDYGSWGDHGLVTVTYMGQPCLCDTALGANGWMLPADFYTYEYDTRFDVFW